MNPLRIAIENALAVAKDRKGFLSAFDSEIGKLEFQPDAESIVLPVPRIAGLAWVRGELDDFDLVARAGPCELIFAFLLPNIRTMRGGVDQARRIYNKGATGFITHTKTPIVLRHWLRYGCGIQYHELDGGKRLYGGETMVKRFFHGNLSCADGFEFPGKTSAANPVTNFQPQAA